MVYQYFHHAFLKCIQSNPEYLIQNMIYEKIKNYHSWLENDILNLLLLYELFMFSHV